MTGPRIVLICNAGPLVGGGHVMRSLTLAQALAARGADCVFLASPEVAEILRAFSPETPIIPSASSDPTALSAALADTRVDAFVFDHYGLDADAHRRIARGLPSMAIDDLADRPLAVELLLDSGPAREASDYDGLLPPGARLLLGPQAAPIRPAFAALRDEALARRGGPVQRVLVSLGLTDVGAITARVTERLAPRLGGVCADIVVGASAPSLPGLRALAANDPRLTIHVDVTDMAGLMAQADIAVGAAGSSTWERCVLGLPSLMVVLADNQREAAQAMADRGAALVVEAGSADFETAFDGAVAQLLGQPALRAALSTWSAELCDGAGADRAAQAFLQVISSRDPAPQALRP